MRNNPDSVEEQLSQACMARNLPEAALFSLCIDSVGGFSKSKCFLILRSHVLSHISLDWKGMFVYGRFP